jgi:hypothetical protein
LKRFSILVLAAVLCSFAKSGEPKADHVPIKRRTDLPDAGNLKIESPADLKSPKFPYGQIQSPAMFSAENVPPLKNGQKELPVWNEKAVRLAPENQVRMANNVLSELINKKVLGVENIRFVSFYAQSSEDVPAYVSLVNFWINQLTRSQRIKKLIEVPGSDGRLWMFDLTWFGWSVESATDVFSREPFFREPLILPETALTMRTLLGLQLASLPEGALDSQYAHCFGIVRGDWFLIETGETLRSTAYYDLLFSRERYVPVESPKKHATKRVRPFPGGVWIGDGKEYSAGEFLEIIDVDVTLKVKKVDFPKDEDDWNKAFGIDKVEEFQKDQKIKLENGAVVDGIESGGSIVARQNRLLIRRRGPVSYHWKTLDTDKTVAQSNYFQTLQFNPDFKAGEVIAGLPNGGQAYGLFNKAKARQEEVPPNLAIDRTDPFDFRVRNPGSCVVCHAMGIITPDCIVNKFFKDGGSLAAKDKDKQEEIEGFFLRMGNKVEQDQQSYASFVLEASGADSVLNAKNYAASRNKYKTAIDMAQASLELGIGKLELQALASRSIQARTVALSLDRGFPIPRTTWDEEVFPEMILLVSVFRDKASKGKSKDLESLIEETVSRYSDISGKLKANLDKSIPAEPPKQ